MPPDFTTSLPDLLSRICKDSVFPYVDVEAGDASGTTLAFRFTRNSAPGLPATEQLHRRYLAASITKPIVAMAFLKLVADGEVSLTERIGDHLQAFRMKPFRRITFRHLLTHRSGLPDMLPDNAELRAAHATLPEFVQQASRVEPEFPAGTDCRYSSVGFLLLGAVIEQLSGQPLPEFLSEHFFEPLGMQNSWLGLPLDQADELMPTVLASDLPEWQPDADDWGWNSRYWRTLGAPWGGLISTAADLGRYARMMLRRGTSEDGTRVLPAAVVAAAMSNQTAACAELPEVARSIRPWGFGWRRQWPDRQASFGDFVSTETIGHWGATGTTLWIDPVAKTYAAILTTTPYEQSSSAIQRISNVIAAANPSNP